MTDRCEICHTTEDLRCCPVMTGDSFDQPTRRPVCGVCIMAWYEGAGLTPEEIRTARGVEVKDG